MKTRILSLLIILISANCFSQKGVVAQKLDYSIHGKYSHAIAKEKLNNARFIGDIIPYYPSGWMLSYISVEISSTHEGKVTKTNSLNDTLSLEQISLMKAADYGTEIAIQIKYTSKNSVSDKIENSTLRYAVTVIPEKEAEYSEGNNKMIEYMKENTIDKIAGMKTGIRIGFTVNEAGEIVDAQLTRSSGDKKTDELFLNALNKMPKWKPAKDAKGLKIKQHFEFTASTRGDGC